MPIKLGSKLPGDSAEARIEIVPLIDIMFFLLAAFMLVSLSMVNIKSMKVNLPTATMSTSDARRDFVDISLEKSGAMYLDKKPVATNELATSLESMLKTTPNLRVFISGDGEARYGDMMRVLDVVRRCGIDKVAFEIRQPNAPGQP